ncbi:MAG: helix-turn-helix domain-containing protein [Oceanospirillaceae bacterium]|nr:helix-turn-helix domain-containing protein [Oceanospirillaceae bacterium]
MTRRSQRAFYRKLYLAWLIDNGKHNLRTLQEKTGMPRRTLQDSLKDLEDIGIKCVFEQNDGERNNFGLYRVTDWGPIRRNWVRTHLAQLKAELEQ